MAKVYEGKVIIPMEKMDEFLSLTSIRNGIAITFTSAPSMHVLAPMPFHPNFEAEFARLEYVGNERFNLAYMRHAGKWCEIYTELSLDECLASIRDEPHFLP